MIVCSQTFCFLQLFIVKFNWYFLVKFCEQLELSGKMVSKQPKHEFSNHIWIIIKPLYSLIPNALFAQIQRGYTENEMRGIKMKIIYTFYLNSGFKKAPIIMQFIHVFQIAPITNKMSIDIGKLDVVNVIWMKLMFRLLSRELVRKCACLCKLYGF